MNPTKGDAVTTKREQLIKRAIQRAIASFTEEARSFGSGGLFELAYPFVAADVPDASQDEVRNAFASLWGIHPEDRGLHERVLAVCDRHSPGEDETIIQVLHRASGSGDLEATYLLELVNGTV